MKIALMNGQILIKEIDNYQFTVIKSWNKMRWNKAEKRLEAPVDLELLERLSSLVKLPTPVEELRKHLKEIVKAVDTERLNPEPVPLYDYPVKLQLLKHQIRGANMALMTFGLVPPEERP